MITTMRPEAPYADLTYRINGVGFTVHRELGPGLTERVYARGFAVELKREGIVFERELPVPVLYRGETIGVFRADFLIEGKVIVELKALPRIDRQSEAQVITYLRCGGYQVGLLMNFGPRLTIRRLLNTAHR